MGIFDSLLSSGLGGEQPPVTPENPVNGTVWTSSQNAAPNPFFRAMNQQTVQTLQMVGNGNIGRVLSSRGIVSGPTGSIINATLDFFLNGGSTLNVTIPPKLSEYAVSKNFIPIIIKTEFKYMTGSDPQQTKTPLYIIFDSTPESISFAKGANWISKAILGRPEPIWTYAESSATTVTITGDFFVNSADEHVYKLKVADYLMSLVTPSKTNFMPSPIQVMIGEWKNFRAIVNNVSIDYDGPWKITKPEQTGTALAEMRRVATAQGGMPVDNTPIVGIPTHAPYHFKATLQLTLVSKENEVQYAEDVINNSGALTPIAPEDITNIQNIIKTIARPDTLISGAFTMGQTNTGYSYDSGVVTQTSNYKLTATAGFKYGDGNSQRQSSDLGIITNAVTSQLAGVLKKL